MSKRRTRTSTHIEQILMATDIADTLHLISDINVEKRCNKDFHSFATKSYQGKYAMEEVQRKLQTSVHRYLTSRPRTRSLAFIAVRAAADAEKEVTKEGRKGDFGHRSLGTSPSFGSQSRRRSGDELNQFRSGKINSTPSTGRACADEENPDCDGHLELGKLCPPPRFKCEPQLISVSR